VVVGFADDLAAAKETPRRSMVVPVEVNGRRHRFKFTQMDGTVYAAETLKHPPRLEVGVDREAGYNLSSLAQAVAPRCAVLLENKSEVELTDEQWADFFAVADGGSMQQIANVVYTLNEFASAKAVAAARKVLDGSLQN
jgi:hypothetical protein